MSQKIEISVDQKTFQIEWALSEHFDELRGKKFMINEMAADQIVNINNMSETAKILLSAVAGAVIQYLMDNNVSLDSIFENGFFIVK
jgi:predicted Fe-Mo cluster-binding NifX family protein